MSDATATETPSRRDVLAAGTATAFVPAMTATLASAAVPPAAAEVQIRLRVNGRDRELSINPRITLLDALRERLDLTGPKKGCDHGQCGACTVLLDGRRVLSCLTLTVMQDGGEVTTIEGLGRPEAMHPLQAAFVAEDAFQCGFCTPGQICSAVAMLEEAAAGMPSHVSKDLNSIKLTDAEIRERMSGNICRCAAYPNIVAAIRDVAGKGAST